MVVIRHLWETDPVEYLVQWKFPKLVAFSHAAIRKTASLSDNEWHDLLDQAEAYRQELAMTPDAERQALVAQARQEEIKRYNEYREIEEKKQFFNQPTAAADFSHWASASYWTLDEAAALSFGKDPRVVSWKAIEPHVKISPFAKSFEARRDLFYRADVMGQLAKQTAPSFVLAWAERMHIPMPMELTEAVKALGLQIADWKTLHDEVVANQEQLATLIDAQKNFIAARDLESASLRQHIEELNKRIGELASEPPQAKPEKPMHAKERESLLKLIIGMAVKGYSYDPKAGRNPTAKEIASDLALIGLHMDEDTVRKYLAEAKELLPGDETEQNR